MEEKMYTEKEVMEWMAKAVEAYRTGIKLGRMEGLAIDAIVVVAAVAVGLTVRELWKKVKKLKKDKRA